MAARILLKADYSAVSLRSDQRNYCLGFPDAGINNCGPHAEILDCGVCGAAVVE